MMTSDRDTPAFAPAIEIEAPVDRLDEFQREIQDGIRNELPSEPAKKSPTNFSDQFTAATRRDVVKRAIGVGVALCIPATRVAPAAPDPARQKPQDGDVLVFTKGKRKNEVIAPDDLKIGEQPILALPKDPLTGVIRNGSRLNRVTVIRIDATRITERMQPKAAAGIVAYSAICTHGGCLVDLWREDVLFCPCHFSRYDAWDDGAIKGGPAPRKLASLPIKLVDGQLMVAGGFSSRVGNR